MAPFIFKANNRDFPGGTVVQNPPANAGDMGLIPGPGRFHTPHAKGHLDPCTTSIEPASLRGRAPQPAEEPLLAATGESLCAAMKTQHSQTFMNDCSLKVNTSWSDSFYAVNLSHLPFYLMSPTPAKVLCFHDLIRVSPPR